MPKTPPPFNSSNKTVECKLSFRPASKKQIEITKYVSTQLSSLIENGTSPDYFLLTQVLSDAKSRYLLSSHKSKYPSVSKNILKLQKQFYAQQLYERTKNGVIFQLSPTNSSRNFYTMRKNWKKNQLLIIGFLK